MGGQSAFQLKLPIGPYHGIRINREIDGELAHGRQAVAFAQRSGGARGMHAIDNLPVDRHAAVKIEFELHLCTSILEHYLNATIKNE